MASKRGETERMAEVHILSRLVVQPSPRANKDPEEAKSTTIHLTPFDLKMLSIDYIQKGILFHKPNQPSDFIISTLHASFSATLNHFYPLAGRLSTTKHSENSLSISLDCNDQGAEFIHASCSNLAVTDILNSLYTPPIVYSFFPLTGVLSIDGHSLPLLAVQATELDDGIFIACSLNHAVADGTFFWHFFNTWAEISRTSSDCQVRISPPVLERWFPDSCEVPIRLPFRDHAEFITRAALPPVKECVLHFSATNIRKLKAKANEEMNSNTISSLQALLAHVWRSVTRARRLEPEQETMYMVLVGSRTRVNPPLPEAYLGNAVTGVTAKALAGKVVENSVGWSALAMNRAIALQGEEAIRSWADSWIKNPSFIMVDFFKQGFNIGTGSSPRFNVYGNDFGWGSPVAVRSGVGNKVDGKVTVYPGPEGEGSMSLEVCLSDWALDALVGDNEFMVAVG